MELRETGTVYSDANHDDVIDGTESGTGQPLYVKLSSYNGSACAGSATAFATANSGTGIFTFPAVTAGNYCLTLSTNTNLADPLASYPGGWIPIETPTGIRTITVATTPLTGQNFGLFNGGRLSGRVFSDTGVGGGTPNDGLQQGGEAGLSGVAVRVTNSGGTVYDSATTAGNGDYTLWIPAAAGNNQLKIVETNPNGYISTGGSGGTYDRTVDSITFTNSVGTIYSGFNFGDVPVNTFRSNSSKSVVAGGTVYHAHTFTAGTGGQVTFTSSAVSSPVIAGWSEVFYLDSNCNGSLDLGETQITGPITATAGQQVCILVKEFAPGNAPIGASNNVTVTAGFAYSNSNPPLPAGILTVADLTTVMQSGLTLLKYVDKASAKPGDTLIYSITYVNTGSTQLTDVVINDNVSTFT